MLHLCAVCVCICRKAQHADVQQQLEACQAQVAALQQQLTQKQRQVSDAAGSSREQATATALLQQQLQVLESRLLDQAQQRGQEQQAWQQRLAAAEQRARDRVSKLAGWLMGVCYQRGMSL